MAFFTKKDGKVVFSSSSKKHGSRPIDAVARTDPKYLQWARANRTVGLPLDIFEAIENVMTAQGIPFTPRRRKRKS